MNVETLIPVNNVRQKLSWYDQQEGIDPEYPIGYVSQSDVALLMRHYHAGTDLTCELLTGSECNFMEAVRMSVLSSAAFVPTEAEVIVVRAINKKLSGCAM